MHLKLVLLTLQICPELARISPFVSFIEGSFFTYSWSFFAYSEASLLAVHFIRGVFQLYAKKLQLSVQKSYNCKSTSPNCKQKSSTT